MKKIGILILILNLCGLGAFAGTSFDNADINLNDEEVETSS